MFCYDHLDLRDLSAMNYNLPIPSLLGLVSRLQPWLLGTRARLSEGVEAMAVVRGTLPYVWPSSFPGELERLPAIKPNQNQKENLNQSITYPFSVHSSQ